MSRSALLLLAGAMLAAPCSALNSLPPPTPPSDVWVVYAEDDVCQSLIGPNITTSVDDDGTYWITRGEDPVPFRTSLDAVFETLYYETDGATCQFLYRDSSLRAFCLDDSGEFKCFGESFMCYSDMCSTPRSDPPPIGSNGEDSVFFRGGCDCEDGTCSNFFPRRLSMYSQADSSGSAGSSYMLKFPSLQLSPTLPATAVDVPYFVSSRYFPGPPEPEGFSRAFVGFPSRDGQQISFMLSNMNGTAAPCTNIVYTDASFSPPNADLTDMAPWHVTEACEDLEACSATCGHLIQDALMMGLSDEGYGEMKLTIDAPNLGPPQQGRCLGHLCTVDWDESTGCTVKLSGNNATLSCWTPQASCPIAPLECPLWGDCTSIEGPFDSIWLSSKWTYHDVAPSCNSAFGNRSMEDFAPPVPIKGRGRLMSMNGLGGEDGPEGMEEECVDDCQPMFSDKFWMSNLHDDSPFTWSSLNTYNEAGEEMESDGYMVIDRRTNYVVYVDDEGPACTGNVWQDEGVTGFRLDCLWEEYCPMAEYESGDGNTTFTAEGSYDFERCAAGDSICNFGSCAAFLGETLHLFTQGFDNGRDEVVGMEFNFDLGGTDLTWHYTSQHAAFVHEFFNGMSGSCFLNSNGRYLTAQCHGNGKTCAGYEYRCNEGGCLDNEMVFSNPVSITGEWELHSCDCGSCNGTFPEWVEFDETPLADTLWELKGYSDDEIWAWGYKYAMTGGGWFATDHVNCSIALDRNREWLHLYCSSADDSEDQCVGTRVVPGLRNNARRRWHFG